MTCASHCTIVTYFLTESIFLCHFPSCIQFHHTKNELHYVKKPVCSEIHLKLIVVGKEKYRKIGNHV